MSRAGKPWAESTRLGKWSYLENHILPTFGHLPINRIQRAHIKDWLADLSKQGYPPATVQKIRDILGAILYDAVDDGALAVDPAHGLRAPKVVKRELPERRAISDVDVRRLEDAIEPRYRAAVRLLAYGGLRPGELWALQRKKIDMRKKTLRIDCALVEAAREKPRGAVRPVVDARPTLLVRPPKTDKSTRTLELAAPLVEALEEHLANFTAAGADAYVFTSPDGLPVRHNNWRRRIWQPACVRAGLGEFVAKDGTPWRSRKLDGDRYYRGQTALVPYATRHTAATFMAEDGTPKQIMERLGHGDARMALEVYTKVHPELDKRLNDAIAKRIANTVVPPDAQVAEFRPREA